MLYLYYDTDFIALQRSPMLPATKKTQQTSLSLKVLDPDESLYDIVNSFQGASNIVGDDSKKIIG